MASKLKHPDWYSSTSVMIYGALPGDLLIGRPGTDAAGMIVRVCTGYVGADRDTHDKVAEALGAAKMVDVVRTANGGSVARAEIRVNESPFLPTTDAAGKAIPVWVPIGAAASNVIIGSADAKKVNPDVAKTATFKLLEAGPKLQHEATVRKNGKRVQSYVVERPEVTVSELLSLVVNEGESSGKNFMFRRKHFDVKRGSTWVHPDDPRLSVSLQKSDIILYDAKQAAPGASCVTLDIGNEMLARVPKAENAQQNVPPEVKTIELVQKAVQSARAAGVSLGLPCAEQEEHDKLLEQCLRTEYLHDLRRVMRGSGERVPFSALKSSLQKLCRLSPVTWDVADLQACVDYEPIDAPPLEVAVAMIVALMTEHAGGFNPQVGQYERNYVGICKRLLVIFQEDAAVLANLSTLNALAAFALVGRKDGEYYPPPAAIHWMASTAITMACSDDMIAWDSDKPERGVVTGERSLAEREVTLLGQLAACMAEHNDLVGVMKGDRLMVTKVAMMASDQKKIPIRTIQGPRVLYSLSASCCYDQHCTPEIGLFFPQPLPGYRAADVLWAPSYRKLFWKIFWDFCGRNARRAGNITAALEEDGAFRKKLVTAQRLVAGFSVGRQKRALATAPVPADEVQQGVLDLNGYVLSIGVGGIPIKGVARFAGYAIISATDVTKALTMTRPSRNQKDASTIPPEAQKASEDIIFNSCHPFRSQMLPSIQEARFVDGQWMLDGRPWEEIEAEGVSVDVRAYVEAPPWLTVGEDGTVTLQPSTDASLEDALFTTGDGVVRCMREAVTVLFRREHGSVARRALELMRNNPSVIALPIPGRDGGMAGDSASPRASDPAAFQLLAHLFRLAPQAACPGTRVGTFIVRDARLLRLMEQIASQAVLAPPNANRILKKWNASREWAGLASKEAAQEMRECQLAAIADFHAQNKRQPQVALRHILRQNVGSGKTRTVMRYFAQILCGGEGVPTTVPAEAVFIVTPNGTEENLEHEIRKIGLPVFRVPKPSVAKTVPRGYSKTLVWHPYTVNIIGRFDLLKFQHDLEKCAPRVLFMFDEFDEMLKYAKNNDVALTLRDHSAGFVADSGTLITTKTELLDNWIASVTPCPFDRKKGHGDQVIAACQSMVIQTNAMGTAIERELVKIPMTEEVRCASEKFYEDKQWNKAAECAHKACVPTAADIIARLARQDREMYKKTYGKNDGGCVAMVSTFVQMAELDAALRSRGIKTGRKEDVGKPGSDAIEAMIIREPRALNLQNFGAMVKIECAGFQEEQIIGRIVRFGQLRDSVKFVTVVVENSLLHILHDRHQLLSKKNQSLDALGRRFGVEALQRLRDTVAQAPPDNAGHQKLTSMKQAHQRTAVAIVRKCDAVLDSDSEVSARKRRKAEDIKQHLGAFLAMCEQDGPQPDAAALAQAEKIIICLRQKYEAKKAARSRAAEGQPDEPASKRARTSDAA